MALVVGFQLSRLPRGIRDRQGPNNAYAYFCFEIFATRPARDLVMATMALLSNDPSNREEVIAQG